MTAEKEYFVYLLRCFLNGETPKGRVVDFDNLFHIADINDVGGIIAHEVLLTDEKTKPKGKQLSECKQVVGLTIKEHEERQKAFEVIDSALTKCGIDRIYVKGIVIGDKYPVKEFRTCGDIDVIVRQNEYRESIEKLKTEGVSFSEPIGTEAASCHVLGTTIEIHRHHDVKSEYFNDIFSLCQNGENGVYQLGEYDHLLYVLCHLAKHLTQNGAGVRMLMDIDVLIRSIDNFNEEEFYSLCEKAGRLKTAQVLLSLCNYWFDTPVNSLIDFNETPALLNNLESIIIDGGSFGFEVSSLSDFHIMNNIGKSGKVNSFTKVKTLFSLAFPPKQYIMTYYEYLYKKPYLLPFAYINRGYDAVFKRGKHSKKTVSNIINKDTNALVQFELLNELEIERDYT